MRVSKQCIASCYLVLMLRSAEKKGRKAVAEHGLRIIFLPPWCPARLFTLVSLVLEHQRKLSSAPSPPPPQTLSPQSLIASGSIVSLSRAPWEGWGATVATRIFGVEKVKKGREGSLSERGRGASPPLK